MSVAAVTDVSPVKKPTCNDRCLSTADDPLMAALHSVQELQSLVGEVVASWHTSGPLLQQRYRHRVPLRRQLIIIPLDEQLETPCGSPLRVEGRDISLAGISFAHSLPLPHRKVALMLPHLHETAPSIVTQLTWCRFSRDGRYQSGGGFLGTLRASIESHTEWHALPMA